MEVGGRRVPSSHPEKVLFPRTGFTKRDLVEYYVSVASALLPHLAGRAVTLARYPEGVEGTYWFQTNCPPGRPAWLRVAALRGARGQALQPCLLEEPAALAWAANAGAIELHPWLATLEEPAAAHAVVFDLDPAPPAGLVECCRVALSLRGLLAESGLEGLVKTSGVKGLHLVVPLDAPRGFAETKEFARTAAERLARATPDGVTSRREGREARAGKVLVDWRQNAGSLSLAAPYSLRGTLEPRVSTPVAWEEVERAHALGDAAALVFGPAEVLARIGRLGDLFRPALGDLPRLPPSG
jgi:bifunctional non-homologous end joining protein LigD